MRHEHLLRFNRNTLKYNCRLHVFGHIVWSHDENIRGDRIRARLLRIKNEFEHSFKERTEEINCALLAILSGEHVLFLGPPGTAKSLLSKNVCEIMDGQFFYYLLTRFTTPEELYGPLSLKALQQDDFHRKIEGYLPTANIAFLDEIFKSNSSILNSLLTILNERKFHNGSSVESVPLVSVFGASNELPEENESLEALYDRFLFRCPVSYVQDESNFADLIFDGAEHIRAFVQPGTRRRPCRADTVPRRLDGYGRA